MIAKMQNSNRITQLDMKFNKLSYLHALSGVVLGVYNRAIKGIRNDKLFLDCTAVHMYEYR